MDSKLKHIVRWVNSKGIKIKRIDAGDGSEFKHCEPKMIFIERHSSHTLSAAVLHEYYHSQQWRRHIITPQRNRQLEFRAKIEYRAETFVIRCFKKLGIIYNKAFIEHNWKDRLNKTDYYAAAYRLLVENQVI